MSQQEWTQDNNEGRSKRKNRGRNEGSIFRLPNGRYRAQITLPRGQRKSKVFQTREACKKWIRESVSHPEVELLAGRGASHQTLQDWFSEWLPQSKNVLRPGTYRDYDRLARDYILPSLGAVPLRDLNRRQINAFYHALQEKKGLGISTVRYTHRVLHRALEMALQANLVPSNQAHMATLPKVVESEMRILNEPQIWTFLSALKDHPREVLYDLAIKTGMREGELLGLQWTDLDFFHGTLTIQRQVRRVSAKGLVLSPLKTKSSRRTVSLGTRTLELLQIHKVRQDRWKTQQGELWQEHHLIFPTPIGTPMDQSNLVAEFKAVLALTGLPEIRFHDLRHTAASVMLKYLKDVLVVSRTLGHSRPSTTLNIYAHLLPGMQSEAAQLIDRALSPTPVAGFGVEEIPLVVQKEAELGMSLGWSRKRLPARRKNAESRRMSA